MPDLNLRQPRQRRRDTECPTCAGGLIDGVCAFCPPEFDDERDQEFAELDSFFRNERTD